MAAATSSPREYVDFLSSFEAGMNSGVAPELLPKNALAWAVNCSLRGGYVHTRPPFEGKVINYPTTALQTLVQTGLFQGGGYYLADSGTASLVAQISGHLLLFTEVNAGGVWNCTDISIPGDLNNATVAQVWMWQAENYLIVQDGTGALPIFFNGTSSRRSAGASQILGTLANNDNPGAPRVPGQVYSLTLLAPFTGTYGVPVIYNGEFYLPVQVTPPSTTQSFPALITNVSDTPGDNILAGTAVNINNSNAGVTVVADYETFPGAYACVPAGVKGSLVLVAAKLLPVKPGKIILKDTSGNPTVFQLNSDGTTTLVTPLCGTNQTITWPAGQPIIYQTPSIGGSLGTILTEVNAPAVGQSVQVMLSQQYSGAVNQPVLINGQLYTISPVAVTPPGSSTTTLLLLDQTDNSQNEVYANAIDGSNNILSVPELPAGRMGAYGMGCNVVCLANGTNYIIGDVIGSASGTAQNNYRDAVLKVTENTFLAGGGSFSNPVSGEIISAMIFPPTLDTSLGQGALMVGTPDAVWSNNVPGTNPATWDALTFPIVTMALKDNGPQGQNSTILVNSDTFYRSSVGIGSLLLARREFFTNNWGNRPVSNELQRVLNYDNPQLLQYGSAMSFDNRFLMTADPNILAQGIFHVAMVVLNFDLLTSLRQSLPPSWEGPWTGLNVLQGITGKMNGSKRAFAFSLNTVNQQTELYELLPEATEEYADNGVTPIQWVFETSVCFNKDIKELTELVQLRDGEIYIADVQGAVQIQVFYRPDYYPCWTPWNTINISQGVDMTNSQPGYRMRLGLGEPSVAPCEAANNRPLREGYFFQLRFVVIGSCVFKGVRLAAIQKPQPKFAPVQCVAGAAQIIDCNLPEDLTAYSLQSAPPTPQSGQPTGQPPQVFSNQTVYFPFACSNPATPVLAQTGTNPTWITLDATGANSPGGNSGLIGVAGTYFGATQAAANALAQNAINNFGTAAVAAGTLFCSTPAPVNFDDLVWTVFPGGDWLSNVPCVYFWCQYKLPGETFSKPAGAVNVNMYWGEDTLNLQGRYGYAYATYFNNTASVQNIKASWNSSAIISNYAIDHSSVSEVRVDFLISAQLSPIGVPTGASSYAGYWVSGAATGTKIYAYVGYASDTSGTGYSPNPATGLNYYAVFISTTPITPVQSTFAGLWINHGKSEQLYVAYASSDQGAGYSTSPAAGLNYYAAVFPSDNSYTNAQIATLLQNQNTTGSNDLLPFDPANYITPNGQVLTVQPYSMVNLIIRGYLLYDAGLNAGFSSCSTNASIIFSLV